MPQLTEFKVNRKIKLGFLWASVMFCYIYCDYFELYTPGKLRGMIQGDMGFLGTASQGVLLGVSLMMLLPSLIVFLSVGLPARYSRILNIAVGVLFTALMALLVYAADWYFYKMFAAVETVLTMVIVWQAWSWPRDADTEKPPGMVP